MARTTTAGSGSFRLLRLVVFSEHLFGLVVVLGQDGQGLADPIETDILVRLLLDAGFVLELAVVLNLLATLLDLC